MANHEAEIQGSIPSTDVGKEQDGEIVAPVPDASIVVSHVLHTP